jgi:PhnB protein
MNDTRIDPYLFFTGNAREAMEFYQKAFGGDLTVQTLADVPGDIPGKAERPNDVMHAALKGGAFALFASDSMQASDKTAKVELCIGGSDEAALRTIFDTLAEGGTVRMALEKQFWGDLFGNLTDKFGVDWMMNIAAAKA